MKLVIFFGSAALASAILIIPVLPLSRAQESRSQTLPPDKLFDNELFPASVVAPGTQPSAAAPIRDPLRADNPSPAVDRYSAPTPQSDFLAAISTLNELLINSAFDRALEGDNQLAAAESVNQLSAKIETLIAAGKIYDQAEKALGRESKSGFIIRDVDAGEIRQLFDEYRRAETEVARNAALKNVNKLVEEFRQAYARHWPNDTGMVISPQPPQSTNQLPTIPIQAVQLPDGRVVYPQQAPSAAIPHDPYAPRAAASPRRLPQQFQQELTQAEQALREAKDEEAKVAARKQLSELLQRIFDDDMQRREQELALIEERVKNLRTQLDLRREKRQEIIDLQIKVLENEAAGLGFFTEPGGPQDPYGRGAATYGNPPALLPGGSVPSLPQIATPQTYVNPLPTQPARTPGTAPPRAMEVKLDEDGRVPAFNFAGQPWPSVLAWYAKLANCSLDWQALPTGGVSLSTQRPISLDDVGRLLNRLLVARGFVFLQRDGLIQVMNIENMDPSLVKLIVESDVYQRTLPPEIVGKLRQLETPPVPTSPPTMPRTVVPEAPSTPPTTPFARAPAAQTRAKTNQAKARVKLLEDAIRMYQLNVREFPTGIQGLVRPPTDAERARRWAGPYLSGDKPPLDPWGNEYRYVTPGIVNSNSFDVWSAGPDGQVGTADDIGNWDPAQRR